MPIRPLLLPIYEELISLAKATPIERKEKKPAAPANDLFYELALKTSIFDRP